MSDWAAPVGADGVVHWTYSGELPCGYRWAVSASQKGLGVADEHSANPHMPGVHTTKADWVADQARQAHDHLCACTFEDEGEVWPGHEFDVTTVTLTKARYQTLIDREAAAMNKVIVDRGKHSRLLRAEEVLEALEAAGVANWDGYFLAMKALNNP